MLISGSMGYSSMNLKNRPLGPSSGIEASHTAVGTASAGGTSDVGFISVLTEPGLKAFTRTFVLWSSLAIVIVRALTPALEAA